MERNDIEGLFSDLEFRRYSTNESCKLSSITDVSTLICSDWKRHKIFTVIFNCWCRSSAISSTLPATVFRDRLSLEKSSRFSGQIKSSAFYKHFLTNSPSVKGLESCAISSDIAKLACTDADSFLRIVVNSPCSPEKLTFNFFNFSSLFSPVKVLRVECKDL